jgi:hypothetical protein
VTRPRPNAFGQVIVRFAALLVDES